MLGGKRSPLLKFGKIYEHFGETLCFCSERFQLAGVDLRSGRNSDDSQSVDMSIPKRKMLLNCSYSVPAITCSKAPYHTRAPRHVPLMTYEQLPHVN